MRRSPSTISPVVSVDRSSPTPLYRQLYDGLREAILVTLDKPHWGLLYIVGSLAVGWHLFHGVQAAFRSVGAVHPRYTPIITSPANPGTIAADIALQFPEAPTGPPLATLVASGLVLFLVTLIVNMTARWIISRRAEFSGAN